MFGDAAPIWRFLKRLDFIDDPEQARSASHGGYVMEVYPSLALLAFDPSFAARLQGPHYNPARRRTFRLQHWGAVCDAVIDSAEKLGLADVAAWCRNLERSTRPPKCIQDKLDAVICLLVAARWLSDRETSVMIGDLRDGYIVAPAGAEIRAKLQQAAEKAHVGIK